MKRLPLRRLGALLLVLGLLTGLEAKAYGLAICPMHQAAQNQHGGSHRGHQHAAADSKALCNCVDACQTGGGSAVLKTGSPRLLLGMAEVVRPEVHPAELNPRAPQGHFLPFATAPPSHD